MASCQFGVSAFQAMLAGSPPQYRIEVEANKRAERLAAIDVPPDRDATTSRSCEQRPSGHATTLARSWTQTAQKSFLVSRRSMSVDSPLRGGGRGSRLGAQVGRPRGSIGARRSRSSRGARGRG